MTILAPPPLTSPLRLCRPGWPPWTGKSLATLPFEVSASIEKRGVLRQAEETPPLLVSRLRSPAERRVSSASMPPLVVSALSEPADWTTADAAVGRLRGQVPLDVVDGEGAVARLEMGVAPGAGQLDAAVAVHQSIDTWRGTWTV